MLGYKMPKVKVRTILQTADDVNKNKRRYSRKLLEKGVNEILPQVKQRVLVGELDHPLICGNDDVDCARHFLVLYERTSHIITNLYFENNTIIGDVETTTTNCGFNMAGLIMDKVPVGFSLRAVGDHRSINGIDEVCDPFFIITWDCVSNPSHASARVIDVMTESSKLALAAKTITESTLVVNDRLSLFSDAEAMTKMTRKNRLTEMVTNLDKSIKSGNGTKTSKIVDNLLESCLKFNDEDSYIWAFLDDTLLNGSPTKQAFKKYLK